MTYMSKLSFQYGFSVFLMTLVVRVCSPLIVATAKGSGKPEHCERRGDILGGGCTYGTHRACRGRRRR
jgi:hypothetical protein